LEARLSAGPPAWRVLGVRQQAPALLLATTKRMDMDSEFLDRGIPEARRPGRHDAALIQVKAGAAPLRQPWPLPVVGGGVRWIVRADR